MSELFTENIELSLFVNESLVRASYFNLLKDEEIKSFYAENLNKSVNKETFVKEKALKQETISAKILGYKAPDLPTSYHQLNVPQLSYLFANDYSGKESNFYNYLKQRYKIIHNVYTKVGKQLK